MLCSSPASHRHVIVVKRTKKKMIAVLSSLVVAAVMTVWSFIVMIRPLGGGLGWSPQRDIEYIRERHSVCLVDPSEVITDAESGYFDWAIEEFKMRVRVGVIAWGLATTALGVWAARNPGREKTITSPTQPTS